LFTDSGAELSVKEIPWDRVSCLRADKPLLEGGGVETDYAEGRHGKSHATYGDNRRHRFTLGRQWGKGERVVCFCMLNPSTADAFKLDPTVTRCFNFAKSWGADGMIVVNLFSLRTPSPIVLKKTARPNAPLNDQVLTAVGRIGLPVVAGWGAHGSHLRREEEVMEIFRNFDATLFRIGERNIGGSPRHPLYTPGSAGLFFYP
jgi:hypothetical protein